MTEITWHHGAVLVALKQAQERLEGETMWIPAAEVAAELDGAVDGRSVARLLETLEGEDLVDVKVRDGTGYYALATGGRKWLAGEELRLGDLDTLRQMHESGAYARMWAKLYGELVRAEATSDAGEGGSYRDIRASMDRIAGDELRRVVEERGATV